MGYIPHMKFFPKFRFILAGVSFAVAVTVLAQGCVQQEDSAAGGELDGVWMLTRAVYHEEYGDEIYDDTLAPDTSDVYMRRFLVIRGEALFSTEYDSPDSEEPSTDLTRFRKIGDGRWISGIDDTLTVTRSGQKVVFEHLRERKEFYDWMDDTIKVSLRNRIEVVAYSGGFPPPEWYAPPPSEAEPNDTRETAVPLSANGAPSAASLTSNDVDWFSFPAVAGKWYRVSTGGNLDTYVELYGSADVPLEEDDDSGTGSNGEILWLCEQSGTYHVVVRGYGSGEAGAYTITITSYEDEPLYKRADRRPKALRVPLTPFSLR
jgi:hypothetical protein